MAPWSDGSFAAEKPAVRQRMMGDASPSASRVGACALKESDRSVEYNHAMLAPIELPAEIAQLHRRAQVLSATLQGLSAKGTEVVLPPGPDVLRGTEPGYLHLVDGFLALRRQRRTVRFYETGAWIATEQLGAGLTCQSDFDTRGRLIPQAVFESELATDPKWLTAWLAYERCQEQLLAGIVAELAVPDEEAETGFARYPAGSLIIESGHAPEQLLVLLDGEAQAEIGGIVLDTVQEGEFIGEVGFLTGRESGADVRAVTECMVQTIPAAAFEQITRSRPEIVLQVARNLAERLDRSNHRYASVLPTPLPLPNSASAPAVE